MGVPQRQWAGGKLLAEVNNEVGLITINRPEKRNAMSLEMWTGLAEILDDWERDDSVRVVVLTGAGDKAFASGADISQFDEIRSDVDTQREYDRATRAAYAKITALPQPVIARIRGYCVGGGLAIAMAADLRIAAEDSEIGIPATRLGIAYSFYEVQMLVSLVGPAHARMMLLTSARIGSAEALRIGLINQVVKGDQLSDAVAALARTIAENAPLAVRATKLTINETLRDPGDRDPAAMERASAACINSDDYREGRTAFMQKRTPKFRGI
jgi:enoyl-CoA hydratase